MTSAYSDILTRIEAALAASRTVFARFTPGAIETEYKVGHDPVTEADRALDVVLRENLLRDGEGWLSEETVDNPARLDKERVWIVDPLDGTREPKMASRLPEESTTPLLRKRSSERLMPACSTTGSPLFPASALLSTVLSFSPAAAK
jgi:hypothetical protein